MFDICKTIPCRTQGKTKDNLRWTRIDHMNDMTRYPAKYLLLFLDPFNDLQLRIIKTKTKWLEEIYFSAAQQSVWHATQIKSHHAPYTLQTWPLEIKKIGSSSGIRPKGIHLFCSREGHYQETRTAHSLISGILGLLSVFATRTFLCGRREIMTHNFIYQGSKWRPLQLPMRPK